MLLVGMSGGNFGTGYSGGYGGGAMKGPGYGQRATGPYGGSIVLAYAMSFVVFVQFYSSELFQKQYISVIISVLLYLISSCVFGTCCLQCIDSVVEWHNGLNFLLRQHL